MTNRRRTGIAAIALAVALTITGCSADATGADDDVAFDGTHVPAAQFQAAIDAPDTVILDVRTPEEFAAGHIPDAINIDVSAPDFTERTAALDPTAPYAVYCRSANRSRVALDVMADQGFTATVGLEGGIAQWPGIIVTP